MYKKIYLIALTCLLSLSIMTFTADAQTEILGPWLWVIAPCAANQGGQASTDIDSLAVASNNEVTEEEVTKKGAIEGDVVGDYKWILSNLPAGGDINVMMVNLGVIQNADLNDVSSYALITIKSSNAQPGVTMKTGSDDSIKVWVNGKVVFTNAVNRGRAVWQDTFQIDLKKGDNLLLVKVSERGGGWGMHVGIDAEYTLGSLPGQLPVEPAGKLTTRWADIKRTR